MARPSAVRRREPYRKKLDELEAAIARTGQATNVGAGPAMPAAPQRIARQGPGGQSFRLTGQAYGKPEHRAAVRGIRAAQPEGAEPTAQMRHAHLYGRRPMPRMWSAPGGGLPAWRQGVRQEGTTQYDKLLETIQRARGMRTKAELEEYAAKAGIDTAAAKELIGERGQEKRRGALYEAELPVSPTEELKEAGRGERAETRADIAATRAGAYVQRVEDQRTRDTAVQDLGERKLALQSRKALTDAQNKQLDTRMKLLGQTNTRLIAAEKAVTDFEEMQLEYHTDKMASDELRALATKGLDAAKAHAKTVLGKYDAQRKQVAKEVESAEKAKPSKAQYKTANAVIEAIQAGKVDPAAPGSRPILDSLPAVERFALTQWLQLNRTQ